MSEFEGTFRGKKRWAVFVREDGSKFYRDQFRLRLWRMRFRLGHWADLVRELPGPYLLIGVTLTYDYLGTKHGGRSQVWEPWDISRFVSKVKYFYGEKLLAHAWVSEVQRNGNPHYHGLFVVRPGRGLPSLDRAGFWTKGFSKITRVRGAGYLVRYAGKEHQKNFHYYPEGMRLFGVNFRDPALKKELATRSLKLIDRVVLAFGWKGLDDLPLYRHAVSRMAPRASPVGFFAALTSRQLRAYVLERAIRDSTFYSSLRGRPKCLIFSRLHHAF